MKLSSNNESGETGGRMPAVSVIDPAPRPTRRTFTGAYKLATVAEYEAAPHGQKNAVLRREGLYHSHIGEWAAARDAGALSRAGKAAKTAAPVSRCAEAYTGSSNRSRRALLTGPCRVARLSTHREDL